MISIYNSDYKYTEAGVCDGTVRVQHTARLLLARRPSWSGGSGGDRTGDDDIVVVYNSSES